MNTTDDTATAEAPTTPPRQRRARRTDGDSDPAPRRTRRPPASGEDLVAQLPAMVDRLIAENRELKRLPVEGVTRPRKSRSSCQRR